MDAGYLSLMLALQCPHAQFHKTLYNQTISRDDNVSRMLEFGGSLPLASKRSEVPTLIIVDLYAMIPCV